MLRCYGKEIKDIDLIVRNNNSSDVRALVAYVEGGKKHNVSCESISWQSEDWNKK